MNSIGKVLVNGSRRATWLGKPGLLQKFSSSLGISEVNVRYKNTPVNTIIMFVPQQEAWVVERMGKYSKILKPGLNFLLPILDKVKYVQILKEIAIDIPQQSAITADNVSLNIDGVLFLKVVDPFLASYGVEDPEFAVTQLAQTTMRSELGKIPLDNVFRERESLNISIVESMNKASLSWGITCLRYEIRDIRIPQRVQDAMQMQVEAERKKRAVILESEGLRQADINVAEGKKQSRILSSEADKLEQINKADGEANALLTVAQAKAREIEMIANSLACKDGKNAASLNVAQQYVEAFHQLAQKGNTVILPNNVGDVSGAVVQAMAIYNKLAQNRESTDENTKDVETLPEREYSKITRLTGSTLHPTPKQRLCSLYVLISRYLLQYPEECNYRRNTEALIACRKSILQEAQSLEEVECLIGCGTFEQLILQAERELELAKKLLKYKPWEALVNHPSEYQWKWPKNAEQNCRGCQTFDADLKDQDEWTPANGFACSNLTAKLQQLWKK